MSIIANSVPMKEGAGEGGLLLVTPAKTNLEGDVGLKSAVKVSTRASLPLSNSEQKTLPHYLRASTGSCHDFCKYGREHTFESKQKHPTLHRFSGSHGTPEKLQSRVKMLNLVEKQRKTAKKKASAHQKTELYDRPKVREVRALTPVEIVECTKTQINNQNSLFPEKSNSSKSSEAIECNFPLPSEKIVLLEGYETIMQDNPVERIGLYDDLETITQRATPFLEKTESSEAIECNFPLPSEKIVLLEGSETIMQDTPVERIELFDDLEIITQKAIPFLEKTEMSEYSETANKKKPSVKKIHLSLGPASVEQRTQSAKNVFGSVRPEMKQKALSPVKAAISPELPRVSKKGASLCKRPDATVIPALSGKSKIITLKSTSQRNPTTGAASRKNESKGDKNVELPKSHGRKTLKPLSVSLSSQPPPEQVSNFTKSSTPVRHPRKVGKTQLDVVKIKEKTLYAIEPRPTQDRNLESAEFKPSSCQLSLSSSSSSSLSLLSSSPSGSDYEGEENQDVESAFLKPCSISEHGGAKANKAGQKSQRRTATAYPEDKDPIPYKLKFRRGKVMNPQSDNSGTRQLRFRQGRRLSDDQSGNGEVERRSFRRKQSVGGNLNHPDKEAQTVVLRHQDVHDKKDSSDLLNQIIEETASKLVKTRKSKVKALVGAFETVISLQESKPAASV